MLALDLNPMARADPQDEATARKLVDRRRSHRDGRGGADKDAGDGGPQQNPRSLSGTGRQHRELVAAMAFGHPSRFVSERFGELDALHDLRRSGPAGEGDAEPAHAEAQVWPNFRMWSSDPLRLCSARIMIASHDCPPPSPRGTIAVTGMANNGEDRLWRRI